MASSAHAEMRFVQVLAAGCRFVRESELVKLADTSGQAFLDSAGVRVASKGVWNGSPSLPCDCDAGHQCRSLRECSQEKRRGGRPRKGSYYSIMDLSKG